jgi:hypothetical protein
VSFFGRATESTLSDTTFGTLTKRKHGWAGEAPWIDGSQVAVIIQRERGPNEEDRKTFADFLSSYLSLVPRLSEALFTLWEPEMRQPHWAASEVPRTAEDLWKELELDGVSICESGNVLLAFAFAGDFWPDAMLTLEVSDGQVRPVSLDD